VSKSKSLREPAMRVTTYAELEEYARAFAAGHLNLLIVCGPPGVGKSQCVRCLVGTAAWVDGTATAFGIYLRAYEYRDRPIVLDDVDGLARDKAGVRLLKALCQTDPVKAVSWETDAKTLDRRGIPKRFTTTSRVAIIANQWRSTDLDTAALEDRGHCLSFTPSPLEVHRQAGTWFWDQEVFDLIAEHLHLVEQHSLRTYILAAELKQAGLDWRGAALARCLAGVRLKVARLKADPAYVREEDRAHAFVMGGFGCRASYFNHARLLAPTTAVPRIRLTRTEPPTPNLPTIAPSDDASTSGDGSGTGRLLDSDPVTGATLARPRRRSDRRR
jgi:hypothetical protein